MADSGPDQVGVGSSIAEDPRLAARRRQMVMLEKEVPRPAVPPPPRRPDVAPLESRIDRGDVRIDAGMVRQVRPFTMGYQAAPLQPTVALDVLTALNQSFSPRAEHVADLTPARAPVVTAAATSPARASAKPSPVAAAPVDVRLSASRDVPLVAVSLSEAGRVASVSPRRRPSPLVTRSSPRVHVPPLSSAAHSHSQVTAQSPAPAPAAVTAAVARDPVAVAGPTTVAASVAGAVAAEVTAPAPSATESTAPEQPVSTVEFLELERRAAAEASVSDPIAVAPSAAAVLATQEAEPCVAVSLAVHESAVADSDEQHSVATLQIQVHSPVASAAATENTDMGLTENDVLALQPVVYQPPPVPPGYSLHELPAYQAQLYRQQQGSPGKGSPTSPRRGTSPGRAQADPSRYKLDMQRNRAMAEQVAKQKALHQQQIEAETRALREIEDRVKQLQAKQRALAQQPVPRLPSSGALLTTTQASKPRKVNSAASKPAAASHNRSADSGASATAPAAAALDHSLSPIEPRAVPPADADADTAAPSAAAPAVVAGEVRPSRIPRLVLRSSPQKSRSAASPQRAPTVSLTGALATPRPTVGGVSPPRGPATHTAAHSAPAAVVVPPEQVTDMLDDEGRLPPGIRVQELTPQQRQEIFMHLQKRTPSTAQQRKGGAVVTAAASSAPRRPATVGAQSGPTRTMLTGGAAPVATGAGASAAARSRTTGTVSAGRARPVVQPLSPRQPSTIAAPTVVASGAAPRAAATPTTPRDTLRSRSTPRAPAAQVEEKKPTDALRSPLTKAMPSRQASAGTAAPVPPPKKTVSKAASAKALPVMSESPSPPATESGRPTTASSHSESGSNPVSGLFKSKVAARVWEGGDSGINDDAPLIVRPQPVRAHVSLAGLAKRLSGDDMEAPAALPPQQHVVDEAVAFVHSGQMLTKHIKQGGGKPHKRFFRMLATGVIEWGETPKSKMRRGVVTSIVRGPSEGVARKRPPTEAELPLTFTFHTNEEGAVCCMVATAEDAHKWLLGVSTIVQRLQEAKLLVSEVRAAAAAEVSATTATAATADEAVASDEPAVVTSGAVTDATAADASVDKSV